MPAPILQISSLEHVPEEPQKPVIVDLFSSNVREQSMIETFETLGNIALDKPVSPFPGMHHFL
jgi:hypothetical protein